MKPDPDVPPEFGKGVIALVDALGFKGIWKDPDQPSVDVLNTLRRVGEKGREFQERIKPFLALARKNVPFPWAGLWRDLQMRVLQFSDTTVIAAWRRPRKRQLRKKHEEKARAETQLVQAEREKGVDAMLRFIVCTCVCEILKEAALADPPLAYRGVVTSGSFLIEENYLLGPAIDEAASLLDTADGPFVWLVPAVAKLKDQLELPGFVPPLTPDTWKRIVVRGPVPLRSGRFFSASILSPVALCDSEEDERKVRKGLLATMKSDLIEVAIKRQAAVKLFKMIDEARKHRAFQERVSQRAKRHREERERAAETGAQSTDSPSETQPDHADGAGRTVGERQA
jgi:hypothetical protein